MKRGTWCAHIMPQTVRFSRFLLSLGNLMGANVTTGHVLTFSVKLKETGLFLCIDFHRLRQPLAKTLPFSSSSSSLPKMKRQISPFLLLIFIISLKRKWVKYRKEEDSPSGPCGDCRLDDLLANERLDSRPEISGQDKTNRSYNNKLLLYCRLVISGTD